jgi:hypothetical protein
MIATRVPSPTARAVIAARIPPLRGASPATVALDGAVCLVVDGLAERPALEPDVSDGLFGVGWPVANEVAKVEPVLMLKAPEPDRIETPEPVETGMAEVGEGPVYCTTGAVPHALRKTVVTTSVNIQLAGYIWTSPKT